MHLRGLMTLSPFSRIARIVGATSITLSLAVVALSPTVAYGYLDPGTGSALIQGLIAAIAAIGLTLKVYWHRVLGFLGLRRDSKTEEETVEEAD